MQLDQAENELEIDDNRSEFSRLAPHPVRQAAAWAGRGIAVPLVKHDLRASSHRACYGAATPISRRT